jgi:hypothetical protein
MDTQYRSLFLCKYSNFADKITFIAAKTRVVSFSIYGNAVRQFTLFIKQPHQLNKIR